MKKLVKKIAIPRIEDDCLLFFAQTKDHVPFLIRRIYYILQSDIELQRGFHAHHKTKQVLFCIQGSVKIVLDNGRKKETVFLNTPEVGIFLDKMIWHEMTDFKKDTILLILASKEFDAKDYIRNHEEFLEIALKKR